MKQPEKPEKRKPRKQRRVWRLPRSDPVEADPADPRQIGLSLDLERLDEVNGPDFRLTTTPDLGDER